MAALQAFVESVDPAQVPARDAIDLVRVLDRISRVADAAKATAAGRVAESSLWSRAGHRSAAHWMARETGVGVGEAVTLLDLAETVAAAPVVADAFASGEVSPRQARAAARAEKAQPGEGRRFIKKAPKVLVTELETDADRIVAAASSESDTERAARLRKKRVLRTGTDADGMGYGHWLLEAVPHARLMALIEANKDTIFREARQAGLRESPEAYAADALAALADIPATGPRHRATPIDPSGATGAADRVGPEVDTSDGATEFRAADVVEDWSFAKVIVRVDLTALDRSQLAPGEICEIAGQGPIPVTDAWRIIDGGAFIASVTTDGTDIDKVIHLGRRPTALQRTALEWLSGNRCSIGDCTSSARLEIDHVADWAHTHTTTLEHLAETCGHHHDLKSHHGYTFGPRRPDGRRDLIPPEHTDLGDTPHPTSTGTGTGTGTDPPNLFDTS